MQKRKKTRLKSRRKNQEPPTMKTRNLKMSLLSPHAKVRPPYHFTCLFLTYSIRPDVIFENFQGDEEGEHNSLDADVFQDVALEGTHRYYMYAIDADGGQV